MTHRKLVARGVSKKLLVDLKHNVLRQLKDQGMLSDPLHQVMQENVLPWLFNKTLDFLKADRMIEVNAENNFNEGIQMPKVDHKMAIKNEFRRKE